MGQSKNILENNSLSRRSFLKGTAALGAAVSLYGCSKDDGGEMIFVGGGKAALLVMI